VNKREETTGIQNTPEDTRSEKNIKKRKFYVEKATNEDVGEHEGRSICETYPPVGQGNKRTIVHLGQKSTNGKKNNWVKKEKHT